MKVVANLVVDFGGTEGNAVLELDDILNIEFFSDLDQILYDYYGFLPDNVGEETVSNFAPGDKVYFRLQYDKLKLKLKRITSTDGQVEFIRDDLRDNSQVLLWVNEDDTHTLSYEVNKIKEEDCRSYGNEVAVKLTGARVVSILPNSTLPANYYIAYDAKFAIYRLHTPEVELAENETYPVTIVAYMEPV